MSLESHSVNYKVIACFSFDKCVVNTANPCIVLTSMGHNVDPALKRMSLREINIAAQK